MMQHQQQQLLQEKLSISQILRIYGKQFVQIRKRYSDGRYGRCALGVIMSYYGWNGKDDSQPARKLSLALTALGSAGIDNSVLVEMNDLGYTFDEIAAYLDSVSK
jgi:hypothetical protein